MKHTTFSLKQGLKDICLQVGDYTLSSGKRSSHYLNCKPLILNGIFLRIVSKEMGRYVKTPVVAGLTLGADPLVTGVAYKKHLSGLIIRKEPKGHGTASQVEGPLPPQGTAITVLEDVTTSGGSAMKAVQVLRDLNYEVTRVVTIVDREDGATKMFKDNGVELVSLFKLNELL